MADAGLTEPKKKGAGEDSDDIKEAVNESVAVRTLQAGLTDLTQNYHTTATPKTIRQVSRDMQNYPSINVYARVYMDAD